MYQAEDEECELCPEGYVCFESRILELCPPGSFCEEETDFENRASNDCDGGCPKAGSYDIDGNTVCDDDYIDGNPFKYFCLCSNTDEYRDTNGDCVKCPKGYVCNDSKVSSLCPIGRICEEGTIVPNGKKGGEQCDGVLDKAKELCPTEGTYILDIDGNGLSVCDGNKAEAELPDMCPESPWGAEYGLGVTVYLPGNSGDMNGAGSWDVTIGVEDADLPYFKGKG
jgi:hypothetical protein